MGVREREKQRKINENLAREESAVMYANKRLLVDDDEVREEAARLQARKAQPQLSLNIVERSPSNSIESPADRMDFVYYKKTGNVVTQKKNASELQNDVNNYMRNSNNNAYVAQNYFSDPTKYNAMTVSSLNNFNNNREYSEFKYRQLKANLEANKKNNGEAWSSKALEALENSHNVQNSVAEYLTNAEKTFYANNYYKNVKDNPMTEEEVEKRMTELFNDPITPVDRITHFLGQTTNKLMPVAGKAMNLMTSSNAFDPVVNFKMTTNADSKIELEKAIGANARDYANYQWQNKLDKYRNAEDFNEKSKERDYSFYLPVSDNSIHGIVEKSAQTIHLTDEEKQMFNYISATKGYSEAMEYYDYVSSDLNSRNTELFAGMAEYITKEAPVVSNILSVPLKAMSGIGYVDDTVKMIKGEPIETNNIYHLPANIASTIRGTTNDMIDSEAGQFFYNTGMSMADFIFNAAFAKIAGAPQIATVLLSTSAATDTVIDAKNRGLSDYQAYALGTVSGSIEYVTEKIPLDNLFDLISSGKSTGKEIIKQIATEGTEEVISSSVNLVADIIISKDKSVWELSINEYMKQGLSRDEAIKKALEDQGKSLALDFLGGGISGGVMGGSVVGFNKIRNTGYNRQVGKQINAIDNVPVLRDTVGDLDHSSKAYNLLYRNDSLKNTQAGKLYNEAYIQANKEVKDNSNQIISKRLYELKEDASTVPDVSEAIRKVVYGEELSEKERNMLTVSPNARQVKNEFEQAINGGENVFSDERIDRLNKISSLTHTKYFDNTVTVDSGEKTKIIGVKSVDNNGTVTYNLQNGDTASADKIDFNDSFTGIATEKARKYGTVGADMFVKMYDGGDAVKYSQAFDSLFEYGKADPDGKLKADALKSPLSDWLNPAQAESAYEAGRVYAQQRTASAQAELDASKANFTTNNKVAVSGSQKAIDYVDTSRIRTKKLTQKQKASLNVMGTISKLTNGTLKVVAFESEADSKGIIDMENGTYDSNTNTIFIDINAGIDNINKHGDLDRAILRTAAHELTHFVEKMSPEMYDGLRSFIYDTLNSKHSDQVNLLISDKMRRNSKLTYDLASREVVADACEMLLKDSETIKKLATENMTLAQKVKNWIDDFVKNIKKAFEGVSAKSQEAVLLEQILGDMTELQNMWDEALEDALRTSKSKGTANGTQENSNIKHSIRYTTDNKPVVVIEENILDGVPENEWIKTVKTVMSENFSAGIPIKGRLVKVNRITKREYLNSNDTRKYQKKSPEIYKDKLNAASQLNEIVLASTNYINEDPNHSRKKDNFKDFARGEVLMHIDTNSYEANVIVALDGKNEMVLYDIVSFKPTNFTINKEAKSLTVAPEKDLNDRLDLTSNNSLPPSSENVNKIQKSDRINSNEIGGQKIVNGISEDGTTIVGKSSLQFSERTYENGGRDYLMNWLDNNVKNKVITREDADDIVRQTDIMLDIMKDIKEGNELPDYARWAETDITTDENGKKISVIVKNGDYAMNLDLSLVCKKRVALNAVLNALVQSNDLSVYTLTETDVAELNKIIKEHDFEIACALCFVDSKRYRVGSWAESFCEGVIEKKVKKYGFNEMVRSLVPKGSKLQIDEFNFTGRDILNQPTENLLKNANDSELDFTLIDKIIRDNPPAKNGAINAQYRYATAIKNNKDLRSILNPSEIISSIGLDAIRTEHTKLFGLINGHQGTAKPKFAHQSVAFKNDILQASSWTPEKAKMVGGVRMQSFSDFMANMVFDYVQMISELSAKNLTSHAYTKEPLFVKLFGLTGIKINMSLVPQVDLTEEQKQRFKKMSKKKKEADAEYQFLKKTAGLRINENGEAEYLWEDETFPYDVAMDIMSDKRYTPNCGTICVGISSPHIRKLLNDERISMVIPYHKSGLNPLIAVMRNIALYNDYTNVQNTRYASGKKLDTKTDTDFDFYGDLYGTDGKEGTHDPKTTADNYLKFCDENNYLPKFDEFRNEPNYYKLLIDFTVYDINNNMAYTEQSPVKPIYPSNEEFKDLIVNGVVKNGITYGGLKQAQDTADRLDTETQEIIEEFRSVLKAKHGQDVLSQKQFSERTSESENFTHRELLRNALSTVAQNDTERDFLARYQREIKDVEKKYEEVAKLRRQIHDISFTKGSDRSQLPAIKNRVAILEDQIQRTDKKLLQLEATKALKDVVEREKKTAVKKANERNKQTFERYKSRKRSSEVREKIKKLHNKIVKSLLYPTDSNYIPSDLAKSMIDVCMAIDFSTDRTAPDGGKTKAQEKRESITKALEKLKDHYEELEESKDDLLKDAYDIEIRNELRELVKTSKVSRIGEMSETQLNAVYKSLKSIYGTLLDAKKMIGTEEGRAISEIGLGIIEEQRQIDRKKKGVQKLGQKYSDLIAWNTVSPMRNILRISGYDKNSELYHLAEQLNEGQRKKDIFVMESHKMFEHLIDGKENKKKYQDAIGKAHDFGIVDVDGNAVEMSKMTAMQLVMSWEREMASDGKHSHLQQSGAIIPNHKLLMNGKVSEAVSAEHAQRIDVDATLINDIFEQLDEWDKEYMEVAHKFFDEKSKNALNETSRVVSHRDVALSEKYIPYKVDEDFVFKKEISDENHIRPTLISMGMLKDTVRNAGQPLVMTSLNHVLDTQIEQVGAYYGLAIPVRNFNKVWNFMSDNRISVRESITKNWGKKGMSVIDQTIRDLQADRVVERNRFIDTANSAFVRSVLNSNISVTLKQLSALPSAYSVLNQRFNGAVYGQFLKMCVPSKYNQTIKEIDEYTAAHWLRRQGLSTQELGDIAKSMGPVKRFSDWLPAAINPTKWIQGMDCLVTASFWDMCKKDIRKQGEFEEGTEEFNRAVADLYNRVIEDTQAVYDTLHRPEVLKTTNALTRQLFMFRSESLQHSGILYEKHGAMLTNKNKDTVRDFAKTAYAQYSSAMSFAILSLVGAALLHKMNPYRDEDEELTPESIAGEILNDLTNVLADLVMPIGGAQLQEFIYGKISGNKYSDGSLSVPAVDFINDFIDSVSTLNNAITAEEPDEGKIIKAVEDLTFKFLGLFGFPAQNAKNIVKAFILHFDDAVNGEFGSFEAGVDRSNTVNYHRATEALIEGDMQKYDDVIAELNEKGVATDKIQSGINGQLKKFYLNNEITESQTIDFLNRYCGLSEDDAYWSVQEWKDKNANQGEEDYSYSKYNNLDEAISNGTGIEAAINELVDNGTDEDTVITEINKRTKACYMQDTISKADANKILSRYTSLDDYEIYWKIDEWDYYKENPEAESGSYKKYADLYSVVDRGGSADIAGTVKHYMDHGVSKKSIGDALTDQYKDQYISLYHSNKSEAADLKNSLLRAYYAAGYDWDSRSKSIDKWLKQ